MLKYYWLQFDCADFAHRWALSRKDDIGLRIKKVTEFYLETLKCNGHRVQNISYFSKRILSWIIGMGRYLLAISGKQENLGDAKLSKKAYVVKSPTQI